MKRLILAILVLLFASPAWAAIVCSDSTELGTTTPADPETISYTTPAGSNLILFIGIGGRSNARTISGVTHAGNAMTLIGRIDDAANISSNMYYIVNPTSGTNDVVVDWDAAGLDASYVIWVCAGVNTASPYHDRTTATGNDTTPSVTVPNLVAGDVVIDVMVQDATAISDDPTVGANQTSLQQGAQSSIGWGVSYQAAADGGVMSWTITSDQWVTQAIALTPASTTRRAGLPLFLGD